MREPLSNKTIGTLAVVTATLIWASSFIALKIALDTMGPMSIIFGRMVAASVVFLLFWNSFRSLTFTASDIKYLLAMVLLEPCLYFLFEIKALQYTSASQAGVITSTMPLLAAIGAGIFLKEIITKKLLLGSSLAILGAIWLSLEASAEASAPNPLLGNTLEFLAMLCAAGYTLIIKHLTQRFSALFLTAIQAFAGALFYLPLALWEWQGALPVVSLEGMLAIVYLGVVVTLGGYGLFNFSLTKLPASRASVFINLIPAFVVILAYVVLGETLNTAQLFAAGVIFLGVFITQVNFKQKERS
ncbi:MAG: DMT family transporter [Campylobacterales bacterium]|nr:DMT family transporter [Campylobacterales bacterium]